MPISDLCSKNLICVVRGTSLQYAAQLMKQYHVGGIVVVNAGSEGNNKPVGIITDRDIVLEAVAENLNLETHVDEIMSANVCTVKLTDGIASVVEKMEMEGVRRMIVVDENGNACGLVSSDDILQLVAKELNGLGKIVEHQVENERIFKPQQNQLLI